MVQNLSDVVSIAATTAGVTGTITVTEGARLKGLRLAWTQVATQDIPTIIELTWAGSPTPLRFVPNAISMVAGTPVGGNAGLLSVYSIPLDVVVKKATEVTIKITSSGNLTVKVGLEWN